MPNGLKVLAYKRTNIPMISIKIDLKAKSEVCTQYPGLYGMMCEMLREGTEHYSATQMASELESRGISLSINPGDISMTLLKEDLEKGLELLYDILAFPLFEESALDKIKNWARATYKEVLDSPHWLTNKIIAEHLYKNHPYGISQIADEAVINAITVHRCKDLHKKVITPRGAALSIVGDFDQETLKTVLDTTLGQWQGDEFKDIEYPQLAEIKPTTIDYYMNRDQVVLAYAGLSIEYPHPDFNKLLLFDAIFAQGLNSRLYQLRQRYGIFYHIDGSLVRSCGKQKGRVIVSTQVSVNQLSMAEGLIKDVINTVIDSLTEEDLQKAKNGMNYDYVDWYASNDAIANKFLILHHFDLPFDYYTQRMAEIKKVTLDEVKEAARKLLSLDKMITVRVGRV
jgi:zinc protease